MIRILRLLFHFLGLILSIILLCIKDPGYDPTKIWLIGSLILNSVLLIPILWDWRQTKAIINKNTCNDEEDK